MAYGREEAATFIPLKLSALAGRARRKYMEHATQTKNNVSPLCQPLLTERTIC